MLARRTWPCSSLTTFGTSTLVAPRRDGLVVGVVDVRDRERDRADAVAMAGMVAGDVGVGGERAGQDQADAALLEHVRGALARPVSRPA